MATELPTQQPTTEANGYIGPERRRPGRRDSISPELVPVLRGEAGLAMPGPDDAVSAEPNQLDAVHGIARGLLLAAVLFWLPLLGLMLGWF